MRVLVFRPPEILKLGQLTTRRPVALELERARACMLALESAVETLESSDESELR